MQSETTHEYKKRGLSPDPGHLNCEQSRIQEVKKRQGSPITYLFLNLVTVLILVLQKIRISFTLNSCLTLKVRAVNYQIKWHSIHSKVVISKPGVLCILY